VEIQQSRSPGWKPFIEGDVNYYDSGGNTTIPLAGIGNGLGRFAPTLCSLRFAQTAPVCNELLAIKKQLPLGNCQGEPRSPTIPLAGMETETQFTHTFQSSYGGNTTIPLAGMETLQRELHLLPILWWKYNNPARRDL
jgi:hypothetical protein